MAEQARRRGRWVVLLLGAWVTVATVAVMWGADRSERELAARVEQVLEAAGLSATVEISGRDVTLSGSLGPADQERALELARSVTGIRRAQWVTAPVVSATTRPPASTSTTAGAGSSTSSPAGVPSSVAAPSTSTTDVTVLGGSIEGGSGGEDELPRTGSELGVAALGLVMALVGTLLVRRAHRLDTSRLRLAALPGLRHEDGSEVYPADPGSRLEASARRR